MTRPGAGRRHSALGGAALMAGLSLLTACGSIPGSSHDGEPKVTITAKEGNIRLLAAQTDTEQMLGRPFTTYRAGSGPNDCERHDGSDVYSYFIPGRETTIEADPADLVKQIDTFWRAKGLTVLRAGTSGPGNDLYEVVALTPDDGSLIVRIGRKTKSLGISGETGCSKEAGRLTRTAASRPVERHQVPLRALASKARVSGCPHPWPMGTRTLTLRLPIAA